MRPLYLAVLLSLGTAQAAPYALPVKLSQISNPGILKANKAFAYAGLNPAQQGALSQNGFVIVPEKYRQFDAAYEMGRYDMQPVFVTTDSMLHIYHLLFDKLLRDAERDSLAPAQRKLSELLVADAQRRYAALRGTPLEGDAVTSLAYLVVAQRLADPSAPVPAVVKSLVDAELKAIDAHAGISGSTIFASSKMEEDYSQYVPRGHYTRSEALKRYFRSMMWMGRMNLRVQNDRETRVAALVTHLISQNPEIQKLWGKVYDPTALLVGKSDDLDYRQYSAVLKKVTGGDIKRLADTSVLKSFQSALAQLPPPQINSVVLKARAGEGKDVRQRETLGFRLMGQRFTIDGAILQSLVYREVGTEQKPREFPRGLDLMAALGSDTALNILKASGESRYERYDSQMAAARASVAKLKPADWNTTVYGAWVYTLQGLARPDPRDQRYPAFIRTPAWSRKDLLTGLGSWTELKHDTILYAKQVMTELGGGGEPPRYPRAYVEPNPAVWVRLSHLEAVTRKVLKDSGMLTETSAMRLNELRNMLALLRKATDAQLNGKLLSRDDNDRLHFYGGWLEHMKLLATDPQGGDEGGEPQANEEDMSAVVADVATSRSKVLEEGTGFVDSIYVVVPDWNGKLQVAHGGVYSQYEFLVSSSNRLTDEAWRRQLLNGQIPPAHPWLKGIVVK
ncbi:DUF3160 domain-containing protein [Deinococcus cavernae]|nr:DUF3160 domain-containing protein [Deinococcus cavernae]